MSSGFEDVTSDKYKVGLCWIGLEDVLRLYYKLAVNKAVYQLKVKKY
jgi:hypothetical protein